ncbi:MAG TPA: hypothetical protein VKW04_25175 [Planctomycetota bacterium]|nr:hypothetical protein [Planctomycetota bacterium]
MTRCLLVAALVALGACSREESPAPARGPAMTDAPPVPVGEAAPLSLKKPAPAPEPALASPVRPKRPAPAQEPAPGEIHLPAFTFRTMDHREIPVQLNGEDLSTTPCLWSITPSLKFTETPLPAGSPPEGSRYIGTSQHPEDAGSKAELYVISAPELLAKIPKLRKGECVLVVKGVIGHVPVQGGLLLYVSGYRFTDYTPLVDPEGDQASRNLRTLWFERIPPE